MATAVKLRTDYSAVDLRRLAAGSRHANQSRRLLSQAAVLDGMEREQSSHTAFNCQLLRGRMNTDQASQQYRRQVKIQRENRTAIVILVRPSWIVFTRDRNVQKEIRHGVFCFCLEFSALGKQIQ